MICLCDVRSTVDRATHIQTPSIYHHPDTLGGRAENAHNTRTHTTHTHTRSQTEQHVDTLEWGTCPTGFCTPLLALSPLAGSDGSPPMCVLCGGVYLHRPSRRSDRFSTRIPSRRKTISSGRVWPAPRAMCHVPCALLPLSLVFPLPFYLFSLRSLFSLFCLFLSLSRPSLLSVPCARALCHLISFCAAASLSLFLSFCLC
jgi:hypothetical protein